MHNSTLTCLSIEQGVIVPIVICLQVAANAPLTEFFQQWDVEVTESLLKKLEEKFAERLQIEKKFQAAEESKYVLQYSVDAVEPHHVDVTGTKDNALCSEMSFAAKFNYCQYSGYMVPYSGKFSLAQIVYLAKKPTE